MATDILVLKTNTVVGHFVDGNRVVPIHWPAGTYRRITEWNGVGNSYSGYCYAYFRHEGGTFKDSLTYGQYEKLRDGVEID